MRIHTSHKSGFTIIELLIALTLGAIVIGMLIYVSTGQRKGFLTQKAREESQESVSRIHGELLDKLRIAGYMTPESVPAIVPYPVTDGPDSVRVTGNYDNYTSTTYMATSDSSTWIVAYHNDQYRYSSGMKIYMVNRKNIPPIERWQEVDTAVVFAFSGQKLILFHLTGTIGKKFPAGSRISTFNSYTFKSTIDNSGQPYCGYTMNGIDKDHVLVDGIVDMNLTYELRGDTTDRATLPADSLNYLYSVNLHIESKAKTADYEYTHPVYGDNYRRETLKSQVVVLNNAIERKK